MIEVFTPSDGNYIAGNVGIILFNHFGSTVSQDTGRDAQFMADDFGLLVLAADRPGTGLHLPNRNLAHALSTLDGYVTEMGKLGAEIDKRVEAEGIKHTILAGRSAAGLGALVAAKTETISTYGSLVVADPIACEAVTVRDGFRRFDEYNEKQKRILEATTDDEIVHPLPAGLPAAEAVGRLGGMLPALALDKFHNKGIFTSTASLKCAAFIAKFQPKIYATLEFAEHSLVVTPEIYERDVLPIRDLRDPSGAPFIINKPAGTVHKSFDNRQYMSKVAEPTVRWALAQLAA